MEIHRALLVFIVHDKNMNKNCTHFQWSTSFIGFHALITINQKCFHSHVGIHSEDACGKTSN